MRNHIKISIVTTLTLILGLVSVNIATAQDMPMPANDTVVDAINASEDHKILASLIQEVQLEEVLKQPGSYTVIAPTDQAFEKLGEAMETVKQNPQQLQQVVLNHLFQGTASAEDISENLGVTLLATDESPSNGVIHVSDKVILNRNTMKKLIRFGISS